MADRRLRDYFPKREFGWRISPAQNRHDAIAPVELAIDESRSCWATAAHEITNEHGIVHQVIVVTDNCPAFKSVGFARFIVSLPELGHLGTRRKSLHPNGVRERAFGSLEYEHLYRH